MHPMTSSWGTIRTGRALYDPTGFGKEANREDSGVCSWRAVSIELVPEKVW